MGVADEFLFDSSAMEKSSIFDWSYLKNIEINEWFLAGGININNLENGVLLLHYHKMLRVIIRIKIWGRGHGLT